MVSTYTTNKSIEKPGHGDYVDTWDVPVNADMDVIDQAFGGVTNLNATTGSATLSASQYRSLIILVSGAMAASAVYTVPSGVGGQWVVYNTTTDSSGGPWTITFLSGGGGSVVVPRNTITTIVCDGTNFYTSSLGVSGTYARTNFIATASQTTFSISYTPSKLDVYVNGVLLDPTDYTATNGTTVVLGVSCSAGDLVSIMTY